MHAKKQRLVSLSCPTTHVTQNQKCKRDHMEDLMKVCWRVKVSSYMFPNCKGSINKSKISKTLYPTTLVDVHAPMILKMICPG